MGRGPLATAGMPAQGCLIDDTYRILMVTTSYGRFDETHSTGLWFEEFAVPFERFIGEGYLVTAASITGGAVPIDPRSEPKDPQALNVAGPRETLKHTQRLIELDVSEYDAVIYPGGHGTMFDFPPSHEVTELVTRFMDEGRVVAAVCHGPATLVTAKARDGAPLVKGRRVTAFTDAEEREVQLDRVMPFLLESRLRELGAEVETAPNRQVNVVVDGKLVTGQNPQSRLATAEAVIGLLS